MNGNITIDEAFSFLQENLGCDILDLGTVHSMIMANKLQQVKKLHTFAITPPKKEGDRWQTYYKDSTGKRKCIKASTEEKLLTKLADIYFGKTYLDKMTFEMLFEEWLEYKRTFANSPNTIKRHKQHFNKYFAHSLLAKKTLRQIDSLLLETEFNRIVRDNNLTRHEWINAKTIPKGMFEYAVRKGYLDTNPMDKVVMQVKYKQVVKKTGKTQTYNTEELHHLNQYLDAMYNDTEDTSFLAVKLNFMLGLRIGELVALKWNDIEDNHVHVVREEVLNQETGVFEVVEHTKTHCDRFVFLTPNAKAILEKIERQNEYIFTRDSKRLTSRQIAYVLEKYAKRNGVVRKSSHKIRKTYASLLASNGVPIDAIRELLGHSDLKTTLGYIYNPLTDDETADLIKKAL